MEPKGDFLEQLKSAPDLSVEYARVAVIVVNYRTAELATRCLASLEIDKQLLPRLEVVVVDGGSADDSVEQLTNFIAKSEYRGWTSVLPLEVNGGFGWANNQAILRLLQQSHPPDFIHLLNPDSEIEHGAIAELLNFLWMYPRVGAVGSQLLEPDGSVAGSAFNFPSIAGEFSRGARTGFVDKLFKIAPATVSASTAHEVDWTTGASVMFRAEALKQAGLFDEGFFLYHEEMELMWRLRRAGWTVAFQPLSRVRHLGGASTGVHSRDVEGALGPRKPEYWYRSRARVFSLTRGSGVAALAYLAWLAGYSLWSVRRVMGLARGAKPFSHQLRDHLRFALPRRTDRVPALVAWNDEPTPMPAWMQRGWS